jgi:hypothetical protein
MVGKFKKSQGGYTHLLVVVDKFTKWIEAKPITKCDGKTATKFVRELIYRKGFPHSITTDNGTNLAKGSMLSTARNTTFDSSWHQSPTSGRMARPNSPTRVCSMASSRDCKCPSSGLQELPLVL